MTQNLKGWFCGHRRGGARFGRKFGQIVRGQRFARFNPLVCLLLLAPLWAGATGLDTIPGHFFYRDTFCGNQLVLFHGQLYDADHPSGTDTLPGAAAGGLDSILHVDLLFLTPAMSILTHPLCEGDTLWVNGTPYHAQFWLGEEIVEGGAANGCDSIIQIDLDVLPGAEGLWSDTLCPDDFRIVNNQRYDREHPAGTEILSSVNGCDSILHVQFFFRDSCPSYLGLVYAPNAFRPEAGEPANAYFYLSADQGVSNIRRLIVIDRWGGLLFLRENFPPGVPELGWDGRIRGKDAPPAVYGFRAEIERIDGSVVIKTGEFALIR